MSRIDRADQKPTVLLVEDDPAHAEIVRRNFTSIGIPHRMDHVWDGEAALDYLMHRGSFGNGDSPPRPDLVLLDLRLPRLGGLGVLAAIKSDKRLESIPVVALTTSKAFDDLEQAYRLGVNSYLVKPLERNAFEALLTSLGYYWLQWNEQPHP
ncbi:MAG: response regulator [Betaproteobacteria bacterium]